MHQNAHVIDSKKCSSRSLLRRTAVSLLACVAVTLCMLAYTTTASAQCEQYAYEAKQKEKPSQKAIAEARTRYKRGTEIYDEGEYQQALIEFERAYKLAPKYQLLFNLGQAAVMAQQYPKALCAFEAYQRLGGRKLSPKRKAAVKKEIENLKGRVATLRITSNVDGADILVNDEFMGKTPLDVDLVVNAGKHTITARKPGYVERTETVTLAGKDERDVALSLEEQPKVVAPPPPNIVLPQPQPEVPPEEPSYVWVGWLVTGVFTASAVGTGIATLLATNKLSDMRDTPGSTREELDDQQTTARALGIATDVAAGAAVVAGGVTLYFTIAGMTEDGDEGASDELGSLELGVSPTGLSLQGTF